MRRLWMTALTVALVVVMAGPSQAVELSHERSKGGSANAFWYRRKNVSPTKYRFTTWYVGVFTGQEEAWSDLYQEVDICRRRPGRDRCRLVKYRVGVINLTGEGDSFTVEGRARSADLSATYPLQEYDSDWNEVGEPVPTLIETHFEGVGDLNRSSYREEYNSGCSVWRYSFRGTSRSAIATGVIGGTRDIGSTEEAYISNNVSVSYSRTCEEDLGETSP
ncbi:MAG TPA: hypothetical protein VGS09_03190 [Actinomycetota bacterium]|jgi:hypothetical protein|nr:hypothetical protein [Actinomycetota bacterium]